MRFVRKVAAIAVTVLALVGCQSSPQQQAGTPIDFAGGGSELVGGLAGNTVGRDLDDANRRVAHDAEFQALEYGRSGAPVAWRSPSGRYGEVIPETSYSVNDTKCREYTQAVYLDGRPEVARGTACRQADGSWRSLA